MSTFHLPIAADKLADQIQAEIETYEERQALQFIDDGNNTTERAQAALQRPERFKGEHDVATAWLRENAKSIWSGK